MEQNNNTTKERGGKHLNYEESVSITSGRNQAQGSMG